jgi:hypothetical protein
MQLLVFDVMPSRSGCRRPPPWSRRCLGPLALQTKGSKRLHRTELEPIIRPFFIWQSVSSHTDIKQARQDTGAHMYTRFYYLFIYLFCQKSKLEGEKTCSDLNTDSINQSSGCWISRGRKGKATSGHRHTWPTWQDRRWCSPCRRR